ncbi:DUF1194 domain-containing protein [Mesorhizobium sp. B2-4-6]|uniref:DUF1194 domain-containing protein n=1 Tax=Mesorhizobium sp. B2-4-6 TaxID=2589943 RepID=UPI00112D7D83|nr:DUF1194 domain-containing protein [Mesorhizobium sp. B2-4-6]TPL36034.1 DUF1194 domain-containing protein [Mesorhizobium sp. B2-4-6]
MMSMPRTQSGLLPGLIALALSFFAAFAAKAEDPDRVDAAIVLAVDTSASIDREQADLQRCGHVEALRSREVQSAIRRGAVGCIAIAYVEWSSVGQLRTVMPWKRICGRDDALEAAAFISGHGDTALGLHVRGRTSLSYAIEASSLMLDNFPGQADSKIVDISANGTNNDGLSVAQARARVLEKGHVINAIAVSRTEPGVTDDLWTYFHDNVIGGPGSFAIAPREPADYVKALKRKLLLEISRAESDAPGDGRQATFAANAANANIRSTLLETIRVSRPPAIQDMALSSPSETTFHTDRNGNAAVFRPSTALSAF